MVSYKQKDSLYLYNEFNFGNIYFANKNIRGSCKIHGYRWLVFVKKGKYYRAYWSIKKVCFC